MSSGQRPCDKSVGFSEVAHQQGLRDNPGGYASCCCIPICLPIAITKQDFWKVGRGSMSFKPINDDHAVQSVAFSIIFEKSLGQGVIQDVQSQHHLWLPDLPAAQTPQIFGIEFGPAGAVPMKGHGIEFSYLRPNGTPAWQLRFDGNMATIECTRYTRWERVWEMGQRHLLTLLKAITESGLAEDASVAAISLNYLDQFVGKPAENDFAALFVNSAHLPSAIFDFGDIWHTHSGWFDKMSDLGPILNNLNVDTNFAADKEGRPVVAGIMHLQQLRYAQKLSLKEFAGSHAHVFDGVMKVLHDKNKSLIASLLVPEMGNRIGIISSEVEEVKGN